MSIKLQAILKIGVTFASSEFINSYKGSLRWLYDVHNNRKTVFIYAWARILCNSCLWQAQKWNSLTRSLAESPHSWECQKKQRTSAVMLLLRHSANTWVAIKVVYKKHLKLTCLNQRILIIKNGFPVYFKNCTQNNVFLLAHLLIFITLWRLLERPFYVFHRVISL